MYNLALLAPENKKSIELEKQASFSIWKIKNGFSDKRSLERDIDAIRDENERNLFSTFLEKHERMMGIK